MDPLKSPILIVLLIAVVVAVLAAIGYIVTTGNTTAKPPRRVGSGWAAC